MSLNRGLECAGDDDFWRGTIPKTGRELHDVCAGSYGLKRSSTCYNCLNRPLLCVGRMEEQNCCREWLGVIENFKCRVCGGRIYTQAAQNLFSCSDCSSAFTDPKEFTDQNGGVDAMENGKWKLISPEGQVWEGNSPLNCCGTAEGERRLINKNLLVKLAKTLGEDPENLIICSHCRGNTLCRIGYRIVMWVNDWVWDAVEKNIRRDWINSCPGFTPIDNVEEYEEDLREGTLLDKALSDEEDREKNEGTRYIRDRNPGCRPGCDHDW